MPRDSSGSDALLGTQMIHRDSDATCSIKIEVEKNEHEPCETLERQNKCGAKLTLSGLVSLAFIGRT